MSYHQTIYNLLRGAGISEAGALGLLGNWECESNCEPYRVQGDFSSYRSISKSYVKALTEFSLSKEAFATDQKGFGLAQWTYPQRKRNLYDYWRSSGLQIDSAELQVNFALKELREEYSSLLAYLKSARDIYEACGRVCREYERPAVNNIDARFQAASRIKYEINLDGSTQPIEPENPVKPEPVTPQPQPDPGWELIPATEYWPPRMVDKNMKGPDIAVLQAILYARGYMVPQIDGEFGSLLDEQVKLFQKGHGLVADGIVGNLTWTELLKRT